MIELLHDTLTISSLFSKPSKVNMSAKKLLIAALSSLALAVPFDSPVEERAACAASWYEFLHPYKIALSLHRDQGTMWWSRLDGSYLLRQRKHMC